MYRDIETVEFSGIQPLRGGELRSAVLIDASWVLYRSFYANGGLSAVVGGITVPTGDIFGFLQTLASICKRSPASAVVLCLDGRGRGFRKDTDGDYKGGRDEERGKVYNKLSEVVRAASVLPNVYFSGVEDFEADDIIYTMSRAFESCLEVVWIYSGDNDLLQAVTNKVKIFRGFRNNEFVEIGDEYIQKKFMGIAPGRLPIFRALVGDKSDNLKGYLRFPKKRAKMLAEKFQTPEELLDGFDLDSKDKWERMILDNPRVLMDNYSMMKLQVVARPTEILYRAAGDWGVFDKYAMKEMKSKYEFLCGIYPECMQDKTMNVGGS